MEICRAGRSVPRSPLAVQGAQRRSDAWSALHRLCSGIQFSNSHAKSSAALVGPAGAFVLSPLWNEGTERQVALPFSSALRRGVSGERRAPPGAPSRLSSRSGELRTQLQAGFPGTRRLCLASVPVQQAPCRAILVSPDRGPGAARERGYEARPQAPHPAPPNRRL